MKNSLRLPAVRINRIYRELFFLFVVSVVVAMALITLAFAILH
jgi:hypothetical protein